MNNMIRLIGAAWLLTLTELTLAAPLPKELKNDEKIIGEWIITCAYDRKLDDDGTKYCYRFTVDGKLMKKVENGTWRHEANYHFQNNRITLRNLCVEIGPENFIIDKLTHDELILRDVKNEKVCKFLRTK